MAVREIRCRNLILTRCRPPTPAPVAAAVEFAPGVGADADQTVIKGLVTAFNEAEAAVKVADLDALMKFYATTYNYHELKLVQTDGVRKVNVTCTGSMERISRRGSPSPLIAGCAKCTTSSKRKGPGDSSEMREEPPMTFRREALLIILSSNLHYWGAFLQQLRIRCAWL